MYATWGDHSGTNQPAYGVLALRILCQAVVPGVAIAVFGTVRMSAMLGTPFQLGQSITFDYRGHGSTFESSRNSHRFCGANQADAHHGQWQPTARCTTNLAHGWLTYAPLLPSCKSKRSIPRKSSARLAGSADSPAQDRVIPKSPAKCNQVTAFRHINLDAATPIHSMSLTGSIVPIGRARSWPVQPAN